MDGAETRSASEEVASHLATGILIPLAIAIVAISSITVIDAQAILLEPTDISKYEVEWTWNGETRQFVGLLRPRIIIENETSTTITGYVADSRGSRLSMYGEEQVVMAKYQFESSIQTSWQMTDRLNGGNFTIPITMDAYGMKFNGERLDSIMIYIGKNEFTVNDGTTSSRQSQVFANSAIVSYNIGSFSGNASLSNHGTIAHVENEVAPAWYTSERLLSNQTTVFWSVQYDELGGYDDFKEYQDWDEIDPYWELDESPILFGFGDLISEGNTLGGAYINYTDLGAFDEVDGDITELIVCDPPSGSFFAVNTTSQVFCAVTDSDAYSTNQTFTVEVVDTMPPSFSSVPDDITIQSDDMTIEVDYDLPVATDLAYDTVTVECDPTPHSYFTLGSTIVTCTATDGAANSISISFTVIVQLSVPIDIIISSPNNEINLAYETDISVAVFGTSLFHVENIDADTVYFGPEEASPTHVSGLDDIDRDGLADILFTFKISDAGLYEGYESETCLGGELGQDDIFFRGCDSVKVMG